MLSGGEARVGLEGGPGLTSHCCGERERDIMFDKLSLSQDCQLTEEDRQLTQSTLTQDFLKILRWLSASPQASLYIKL